MPTIQEILANVNGTTFISINTKTPVKLAGGKKNLLQGRVEKVVTGSNVMVFQNKTTNGYENMVNRRLEKEGKSASFTVSPRAWGERITNTPFVEHDGKLYLEVIFLKGGEVKYFVDGAEYNGQIDGLPIHQEAHQGGLDNSVIIRTFKVENITSITVDKQTFVL